MAAWGYEFYLLVLKVSLSLSHELAKRTSERYFSIDLLPPSKTRLLTNRGHSSVLPQIRTEGFKRSFINGYLFNFICLF